MEKIHDKVLNWALDLDDKTIAQATRTAELPIIGSHVALMPDAHLGYGVCVGAVVPTVGAIIPSCVGVDIGCGMAAVRTDLDAADLPEDLDPLLGRIARAVPAGVGAGHGSVRRAAEEWLAQNRPRTVLSDHQEAKAADQLGTLGSGNHFVEVCLDEDNTVWLVLHSGSRGIGNQLAQHHIESARVVAAHAELDLEDTDLAYLLEGTAEFDHYVADLLWAQAYALKNRDLMLDAATAELFAFVASGVEVERVSCHHNYAARETHAGVDLWVTRKGAIRAGVGDRGIIPGSMGAASYIVEGLGSPASFESCSHGAGRTMSRNKARKMFTAADLTEVMGDRAWLGRSASRLTDEHPGAYKNIDEVMAAQADLVTVTHKLTQVLNYKGL